MGENLIMDMFTSWAFWLISSVAGTLLVLYVTIVAPAEAGRRARRGTPPPSPLERDPTVPDEPVEVRVDAEQAMVAALSVHGDRIDAAHRQLIEARVGTSEERLHSLGRALELLAEATMARTDSHEAAEARAHVHLQRADLVEDESERDAALRMSAEAFLETTELRPRELDAYLGAGAVWLRLAKRWEGEAAVDAADVAAATYERAFDQARNNVSLMRAWGTAIDALFRLEAPSYEARRAAFDAALRVHRDGEHDLAAWLRTVMAAAEPPPEPIVEPLVIRHRLD